jgi:hypothetical protein
MTRRRVVLKGWRLYSVMLLLTYLLLFGWLWIKTKLLHGHWHSYMDFSLGEIAILAGIGATLITISVALSRMRK